MDGSEHVVLHHWENSITYRIFTGETCLAAAKGFVQSSKVPTYNRHADRLVRFARRMRTKLLNTSIDDTSWWPEIIKQSRPYSTINLD